MFRVSHTAPTSIFGSNATNAAGAGATRLRGSPATRCLVGAEHPRHRRLHQLPRLRNLGCLPERELPQRSVPVAVLFAGALGRFTARDVRAEARVVAGVAPVFTGTAHPAEIGRASCRERV